MRDLKWTRWQRTSFPFVSAADIIMHAAQQQQYADEARLYPMPGAPVFADNFNDCCGDYLRDEYADENLAKHAESLEARSRQSKKQNKKRRVR